MKKFCFALIALLFFSAHAYADMTYKIKKGDTLSKISKKFNISVQKIRNLNNLKKSAKLRPGRRLIVKKTGSKSYTARKGDNIYKVARKVSMDVDEIKDIEPETETPAFVGAKIHLEEEIKQLSESEELSKLTMKDRLILFANKFLDIPYKFGGNSIMGIDCSAYVQKVYSLVGIELPRSARLQFQEGEIVDRESLSIGDLVFFRTYASFPSHVGIYLGNDLFIHASSKDRKVSIESLKTPYYFKRFIGGKRFIIDNAGEAKEDGTKEG